jgi:ComF family protein
VFFIFPLSPFGMMFAMKLLNTFLNFLFPTKCIVCNTEGPDICTKCLASFEGPKPTNYDWITSLWNYRDPNVEHVMRHIKNVPNKRVAKILSPLLRQGYVGHGKFIIVPIPIGRARMRERGYNQSLLLARPLATLTHQKLLTNILIKSKQTKKQGTAKNKQERILNIAGSFQVKNPRLIKNKTVLLVDDITTTSTTLYEARKLLLESGAHDVIAVTVAN